MEKLKGKFPDINDPKKPVKLSDVSVGNFLTIDGISVVMCYLVGPNGIGCKKQDGSNPFFAAFTHTDRTGQEWPRWCEVYYNQDESLTV